MQDSNFDSVDSISSHQHQELIEELTKNEPKKALELLEEGRKSIQLAARLWQEFKGKEFKPNEGIPIKKYDTSFAQIMTEIEFLCVAITLELTTKKDEQPRR